MLEKDSSLGEALVSLDRWRKEIGRSRATCWRWRQKGWLKVVDIAGKAYLTKSSIADFQWRAANGEFKRERPAFASLAPAA